MASTPRWIIPVLGTIVREIHERVRTFVVTPTVADVLGIVGVRTDVDSLSLTRSDVYNFIVLLEGFHIECSKVSHMLVCHIWVRLCEVEVVVVSLGVHIPDAIVVDDRSSLCSGKLGPLRTLVAPRTSVLFGAPGVSHLHEFSAVGQLSCSETRKGVAVRQANVVDVLVATCSGVASSCDHPA